MIQINDVRLYHFRIGLIAFFLRASFEPQSSTSSGFALKKRRIN